MVFDEPVGTFIEYVIEEDDAYNYGEFGDQDYNMTYTMAVTGAGGGCATADCDWLDIYEFNDTISGVIPQAFQ